jgi:hypothetical protein
MTKVFHWNGRDLPPELAGLPPGDYAIVPVGLDDEVTPDDEAAILEAIAQVDRGETLDGREVLEEIRQRIAARAGP